MTTPRLSQPLDDPAFVQDPYPFYAKARALGDVFFWEEMGMHATASHRATSLVLRDRRLGRVAPTPRLIPEHLSAFYAVEEQSLLELERPHHTRLRGLVLHAFTSRAITALAPTIQAEAEALIDAFPSSPFDLLTAYARPLPVAIIADLLGLPRSLCPDLLDWSNAIVRMYTSAPTRAEQDAANSAARDFTTCLKDQIAFKRCHPAQDLISELLGAQTEGDRLSEAEMISTCILLLNAGHEATVHTLGNATRALLTHDVREITDTTVEELLRLDPPLHLFTRWINADIDIFGTALPQGTQIAALLGAANHDAAIFADPTRFDPTRDARKQLAFGAGIHFCVGAPLARLEIRIALETLLKRAPELALTQRPAYGDTYHFHGLQELPVTC